jgi:diaminopimelate epimerase
MLIPFSKMHGLGNDFVVFDATRTPLSLTPARAAFIADRHFGIGCDQILVVEPPRTAQADFTYRIFNADGSESGQCGNGARCFALFVREKGLSGRDSITVDVHGGHMRIERLTAGRFRAELGVPRFEPADIPIEAAEAALHYAVQAGGEQVHLQALSLGNPHAVLEVDNVESAPVERLGPLLERHPRFPQRVNVGFMQPDGQDRIKLRVYERGVGETLACGSGACAAGIAARRSLGLGSVISVAVRGGILAVDWAGEGQPVYLTGPAVRVFDGEVDFGSMPQVGEAQTAETNA